MERGIGLDFGTTNCALALAEPGREVEATFDVGRFPPGSLVRHSISSVASDLGAIGVAREIAATVWSNAIAASRHSSIWVCSPT